MAVGVVGVLAFAAVNVLYDTNYQFSQYHRTDGWAVVLALLAVLPLLGVRRWPWAVLAITSAAVLASTEVGYSRWVAALGPMLGAGLVLAEGNILRRFAALVGAAVVVWVGLRGDPGVTAALGATIGYAAMAVLIGLAVRVGGQRLAARR